MTDYKIVSGDTLSKIAFRFYNDGGLAQRLAEFNGITNPDRIYAGQVIQIPGLLVLSGGLEPPPTRIVGTPSPPSGLAQIRAVFGNPLSMPQSQWETESLTTIELPFPMTLSWDLATQVRRLRCHTRMAPLMTEMFTELKAQGHHRHIHTFAGCYNFRPQKGSGKLSTHTWGISLDINPEANQMGTPGSMPRVLIEFFSFYGFEWGGTWSRSDPMHFQYCKGY
jgi:LysM repeat protein